MKHVYLVTHTMFADKKAVLQVFEKEERAREFCEYVASNNGELKTDHIWDESRTKYFIEKRPGYHLFEIQEWEVSC